MANIFSFPPFFPSGNWTVTGYNVYYSTPVSLGSGYAPNYYGPWNTLTGYQNVIQNTDILDASGLYWTLYRVAPIVSIVGPSGPTTVTLPMSRPFKADDQVFDTQISMLLQTFRDTIKDNPVHQVDSTLPSEGTGASVMPFITDSNTSRFYPAFLPNTDPIKFISESVLVYNGISKSAANVLVPYSDYYPADKQGFVDFKVNPSANSYLRVEYDQVTYSNDELRSYLLSAVSSLSMYGINGFQVAQSNNLTYLVTPLPNMDLGELVCKIAYLKLLNADLESSIANSEAWKDGKFEWTADPSRSVQAGTTFSALLGEELRIRASQWIYATRNYQSRGEIGSFFSVTGILPVYTMIVAGFGMSNLGLWWI